MFPDNYGDAVMDEEEQRIHRVIRTAVRAELDEKRRIPEEDHIRHHTKFSEIEKRHERIRYRFDNWVLRPAIGLMTVTGVVALGKALWWIGDTILKNLPPGTP